MENFFPGMITSLPLAEIQLSGLSAWLLQASDMQVLFMEFDEDAEVPEHNHEAQWGVVLGGEIELTFSGESHIYRKGDAYFIPKGLNHSAKIKKGYRDFTLFNQKDRYKVKT